MFLHSVGHHLQNSLWMHIWLTMPHPRPFEMCRQLYKLQRWWYSCAPLKLFCLIKWSCYYFTLYVSYRKKNLMRESSLKCSILNLSPPHPHGSRLLKKTRPWIFFLLHIWLFLVQFIGECAISFWGWGCWKVFTSSCYSFWFSSQISLRFVVANH